MILGSVTVLAAVMSVILCAVTGGFAGLAWLWMVPAYFAGSWLVFGAIEFLVIWIISERIDPAVPQEEDSRFHRVLAGWIAEAIIAVLQLKIKTRGLEKTPESGRFLLVCNHLHYVDPVILLHYFKKSQLAFISKRENGSMFIVGKMMHKILCQPINRENDREALKTILKCIQLIKEDKVSIAVFPEGYTSLDGRLQHFRSGVFKIAQKANVPIVVCTLTNCQYAFKNGFRLRPTHIDLHLLDVIQPEQYKGMTAVELGDRVHQMMLDDLGPDYAPVEQNT